MAQKISTEHSIIQNFCLIWFDPIIDQSDNSQRFSIDQLEMTFQTIFKFNDENQCVDFFTDIQYEKVFMIISNSLDQHLVSRIHDISQLDSIYIYQPKKLINEEWINNKSKIKGVFEQDTSLIELLKQKVRQYDQNSVPISIISSNVQLNQNLDQLDPTFIYTQMLKEILLEVKYNERSINDLAEHISTYYPNNQLTLKDIKGFEEKYDKKDVIWWYTSAVFIYSTLNRALRTLEVDTIIKMGKLIHDLHINITEMYVNQNKRNELRQFNVYRGQSMSKKDFDKLKQSPCGLLSFNNFLSTSHDQAVSFILAESASQDPNFENLGVLFQMEIDGSLSSAPYAYINEISNFQSERETLFSMNTVFRIGEIKPLDDSNRLWQVNLTITNDTDQELIALANYLRKESETITGWFRLVPLLIRLGEFKKAKDLCEKLLQTTLEDCERASIYGQLGYIDDSLSNYRQAISWYQKAFEIMHKLDSSDSESLASTYNNIGLAFRNLDEPKNALSFLEKGLKIYKKVLPSNHPYLGVIYNNIGLMYDSLGEQKIAAEFYEKAISFKDILPQTHPELATTNKNIGAMYKDKGDFSTALQYIKKALAIEERSLPTNHPSFAISYNYLGNIYHNLGEYPKAILFYQNAIEISKKNYGENHQDVAIGYGNISSVYIKMCEYSKAVSEGEKAIEIGRKIFAEDHVQLATFYNTIGLAYCHLNEHQKAFSLCEKSVIIYENKRNQNSLKLANGYISLGGICMVSKQHKSALEFFEKGRIIQERYLSADHPDLSNTYTNLGQIYFAMKEHVKALFFGGKGLIIRQKILSQYHPELITSYITVAGPLVAMRKIPEARSAYNHAVQIAQHSLPVDHQQRRACEMMYNLLQR